MAVRILMLSNLFPPEVEGGAEILAREVAQGLIRLGHDVQVLTSMSEHALTALAPALSAQPSAQLHVRRTLRLAGSVHLDQRRPLWRQLALPYQYYRRFHRAANVLELRRAIAETRPDVLYIWEIAGLGAVSLLAALPMLRLPVVFHLNSYWLLYMRTPETEHSRLHARWLKRRLIGAVPSVTWTSLIAVSATVKAAYARAGFDAERIEVIHNGVAEKFAQLPLTRNAAPASESVTPTRLLFVGRLCPEKGVLTALKALALLTADAGSPVKSAADLRLDIVGDGNAAYVRELREFVRRHRLAERVTFHGRVPQDDLISFYDHADILLNTSLWQEPFGLTTVEAMARGLPVIAARIGGSAEIVTHEVNGLLTEPGDEHALALAIRQVAADPARRLRLARAARQTVQEHFTIEENARRIARHLQRAAQGDPAAVVTDAREAPSGARRAV